MRKALAAFLLILGLFVSTSAAYAVNPDEMLADPKLEARARALSERLRCMVCQNESIDDSNADLARDLRLLVRKRIVAGDSDQQVLDYLVSRYGEFVLLKPRFSARNFLLWAMPVIVLVFGAGGFVAYIRRRDFASSAALTPEEEKRLTKILGEGD
jgi:cytochrome c-type biogenesis protein CcmH